MRAPVEDNEKKSDNIEMEIIMIIKQKEKLEVSHGRIQSYNARAL